MSPAKRPADERYWEKVAQGSPESCWPWTARKDPQGYGRFSPVNGVPVKATRFGWELIYGYAPGDLHVLHTCDNPSCMNPSHWFLGTNAENHVDKMVKGRQSRGEHRPLAKITYDQADEIRTRSKSGESTRTLAKVFGIHHSSISRIINNKLWKRPE